MLHSSESNGSPVEYLRKVAGKKRDRAAEALTEAANIRAEAGANDEFAKGLLESAAMYEEAADHLDNPPSPIQVADRPEGASEAQPSDASPEGAAAAAGDYDPILIIAEACHETNRAYCASLGDFSQKPWSMAPQWARDSAITGVTFIINNPDASPAASHESWLAEKEADGWAWGPEKDAANKIHPCFVPYDELPVAQKSKDYIFGATVRTLWKHLGAVT